MQDLAIKKYDDQRLALSYQNIQVFFQDSEAYFWFKNKARYGLLLQQKKNIIFDRLIKSKAHLKKSNFSDGFCFRRYSHYKNMSHNDRKDYQDKLQIHREQHLKYLIKNYNKKFSIFLEESLTSSQDMESFDNFAVDFLSLLKEDPSLVLSMDIFDLTNILKSISLVSLYQDAVANIYQDFFMDSSKQLLKYLRETHHNSYKKLAEILKENKDFNEKDLYSFARTQNDLIWLAVIRNGVMEQSLVQNKKKKPEISKRRRKKEPRMF